MSSRSLSQALRLDNFATQLKADVKFTKEKLEAVQEDRNWLEKQLKQSKKSGKLMKAELELRKQAGSSAELGTGAQLALTAGDAGSPQSEYRYEGGEGGEGGEEGMFPPPVRPGSRGLAAAGGASRARPPAAPTTVILPQQSDHNLASALAMVERLQKELAQERATVKALRAANVSSLSDRTELEAFFLQCIEEVRYVTGRWRDGAMV